MPGSVSGFSFVQSVISGVCSCYKLLSSALLCSCLHSGHLSACGGALETTLAGISLLKLCCVQDPSRDARVIYFSHP